MEVVQKVQFMETIILLQPKKAMFKRLVAGICGKILQDKILLLVIRRNFAVILKKAAGSPQQLQQVTRKL